MNLTVEEAKLDEVFADTVRIPKKHRNGTPNGTVVRIKNDGKAVYAVVRGLADDTRPVIWVDEFLRRQLGVALGGRIDSANIVPAKWWQHIFWYYHASNPSVRVPARVAVISLCLGVLSVALGIWSVYLTYRAA
ncbi:hypothetical protein [Mesorhizobium sp. M0488]|uniref:hypothetical protein n=1 Tax=unclassified Mesorhizobium TaxID=325217 RepID=UPI003335F9C3